MNKLNELLNLAYDYNIIIEYKKLPQIFNGYYYGDHKFNLIIINTLITTNIALYKAVLAEEIGHFFTCIGIQEPTRHNNYSNKITIDKFEEKAFKWACDFLVNTQDLLEFLSKNELISTEDLSNHYNVSEKILLNKLRFMSYEKSYFELNDKKILILENFPTIYVIKKIRLP